MNDRPRHGNIAGVGSEIFAPRDSGVVDKNVEFRELFLKTAREGIHGTRIFNVELHAMHAGVGCRDLLEEWLTAAGDDDLISASMKIFGKGAANAAWYRQ